MLTTIAGLSIVLALLSVVIIVVDLASGHRQHMWIMNAVWPLTALWAGPVAVWGYFRFGRAGDEPSFRRAQTAHQRPPNKRQAFPVLVGKGATHCGSGCALGDMVAELVMMAVPFTLFGHEIFAAWVYDLGFALALGLLFQYFTIKPMRSLSPLAALKQAAKADTLSLLAWQIGMYGWMAIATFVLFQRELSKSSALFWFMMQIAMFFGFATSYPVNWWLLRRGVKETM